MFYLTRTLKEVAEQLQLCVYGLLPSRDFIPAPFGIALLLTLQAATYSPAHLLLPQETHLAL
jgi:hypothetical protein